MLTKRVVLLILGSWCLFALTSSSVAWAQTANVTGTVTDPAGALVPNATVELKNTGTNAALTTQTNDSGQFTFTAVEPGPYALTITRQGFAKFVAHFDVAIGRGATVNATLQIGTASQTVEVVAGTGVELQTLDASVGNVMNEDALQKLPSLSRDATAILLLQPMTAPGNNGAPGSGEGDFTGGQVAGARSDQNTFILDGGDATSNTEASGGYAQQAGSGFAATPRASVPTPVESLQEFRVVTNNSNSFSRSAGGEVQMVTRSGTNDFHGAVYDNLQNTDFNANLWQLNRVGKPRPVWIDNRFGGRLGGPIIKNKAYFFTMYEGRRFKRGVSDTRLVPSALLKQGILQFKDATGAIVPYDLKTSAACVAGACDPRAAALGFSLNPIVSQIWGFEPNGNNVNEGDGLNTIGFDYSVPSIVNENLGIARFDYKLSKNWDFSLSYRYFVNEALGTGQNDIGGILPGHTKGLGAATRSVPTAPRYLTLGLIGRLSNTATNDFHFDWLRHWWAWSPVSPFPQVPGTAAAVQIFSESRGSGLVPLNIDTQNARKRSWNGQDLTWNDNLIWLKGNHMLQFGGEFRREHFTHVRDDKVVGGLTSPVYFALFSSADQRISGAGYAPPLCDPTASTPITTNCLASGDVGRWNSLYAAVTGYLRRGTQLLTRQSDFSPNPPGTPLFQDTIVRWYDLRFSDTWKIRPSFTLSYGLGWGAQTPPYETTGRQTIMTDFATGKIISAGDYLASVMSNAAQGRAFVPELAYVPIRTIKRKYPYDPEWKDFDPRLSFAWNPSFREGGWLNRILGDKKSVIRSGYGRYHDRLNGVGIVMIPALGVGFGNGVVCRRALATGGGACGTSRTNPATGFRIGVDGSTLNMPSLRTISGGVLVPGFTANANSPYEIFDWRIDPHRKVGVEDTWTLSWQRALPSNMLLEVGYVGRTAHHLYGAADLNQVPYMWKAGGQTFADAYDALLHEIDAGTCTLPKSGLATGCTSQPWYETMLAGNCAGFANCTQAMLSDPSLGGGPADTTTPCGFQFCGLGEFSNVLDRITGSHWFDLSSIFGPTTPFDTQIDAFQVSNSIGNSNYHAGYISLRKQTSHGLMFQANYTWSRSMDTVGVTQANTFITQSDNFRKERDYGPSAFDRRHTFNQFFVYDLPFGGSHRLSTHNWFDRVTGGWSVSGAFTASSGLPGDVWNGASCEEFGNGDGSGFCSALIPLKGTLKAKAHYTANGVNAFADPVAAVSSFRKTFFSDLRLGNGAIRGFNRWNMDAAVSKDIRITERVKLGFAVQAVNVFNHMEFDDIALRGGGVTGSDISTPSQFGALTTQYSSPRFLNMSFRIDF